MQTIVSFSNTDTVMQAAKLAFTQYQQIPDAEKANFLDRIAFEIETLADDLINITQAETNLPTPRLLGERGRTTMQLRMFAQMLREGTWVEASIDTAIPDKTPPKPDIRKMLVGIGPVIVFGASNFPYAYSTAGGDTASALAAGCSVVVKAHPAHIQTSTLMASAIAKAIEFCKMPAAIFQHVTADSFETGKALVQHPATAAVGFTGSFSGGKALYDYAAARPNPIPVFSEMGSTNPVLLLPNALETNAENIAKQYAGSITLGVGQFCTNPGILLGIASTSLDSFATTLATELALAAPSKMLHTGILKAYQLKSAKAIEQAGVTVHTNNIQSDITAQPLFTSVSGEIFLANPLLHEEVFGPYAILVVCKNETELITIWEILKGQLTTTLMGTAIDFENHAAIVQMAPQIAGRVLFNGVPTGVEVCASMVHSGPFPACTDSRFTAVGINAVKRWVRPVCFQNCPSNLLPIALKDENPLQILRLVDGEWKR
ncbi:MAG: aldehyde dehydrogenase (NADP(+)) [Bacteroidetes bacterium]|nr:aldehyde dehydrogenase (NADP(+)) [Bacteroidota bacterium]